jgi:hypothetical protein
MELFGNHSIGAILRERNNIMIAVYKANRKHTNETIKAAYEALSVLRNTVESMDARHQSAASERAALEALQKFLDTYRNTLEEKARKFSVAESL